MENVITIKNVTKQFKEAVVLNNISVSFEKGKVHGLIGRNGSGKTMLMKCICGIVPLTSGEITVSDKVIGKDTDIPKDVGVIIETPGFLPGYSGYGNLKFLAAINGKIGKEEIRSAIKSVGLNPDDKKRWVSIPSVCAKGWDLRKPLWKTPSCLFSTSP